MPGEKGDPGDPGAPVIDPDLSALEKLIAGAGGEVALEALTTVQLELTGFRAIRDESFRPEDPALTTSVFSSTSSVDLTSALWRLDYTRQNFVSGGTLMSSEIIRDQLGYVDGVESILGLPTGNMLSDRWASTIKTQTLLNPYRIARSAIEEPDMFEEAGVALIDGSVHHVLIAATEPPTTIYVNARTGLISALETLENDYLRGDVLLGAYFIGWRTVGDVWMPTEVYLSIEGEIVHGERRLAFTTNAAIPPETFEFPGGAAPQFDGELALRGILNSQWNQWAVGLGFPNDGVQSNVVADELSPGVYLLAGGSHHSLVIEQADSVVLVEAPLYEARSEAIIAWVTQTFPTKPISHAINTHHHADHTGGLRTFGAIGATIVVSEETSDFFAEQLNEIRTVVPDRLSMNPIDVGIQAVPIGSSITIADAVHPVAVYHVASSHAADMLAIYLPNEQLIFTSDLYNPGFPVAGPFVAYGVEYAAALVDLGIPITTVAGGHGFGTVTYQQFRTSLGLP